VLIRFCDVFFIFFRFVTKTDSDHHHAGLDGRCPTVVHATRVNDVKYGFHAFLKNQKDKRKKKITKIKLSKHILLLQTI